MTNCLDRGYQFVILPVLNKQKREGDMLRFFCATAGKSFDSGIIMDAETYARERLNFVAVECLHCRGKHRFLVADAEFQAEAA